MSGLSDLLPTILIKSREGKLDWEDYSDSTFAAVLGNMTISIDESKFKTGPISTTRYALTLRGAGGSVIDKVVAKDEKSAETLREIFDLARRRAYRVDESLDELKDILGRL